MKPAADIFALLAEQFPGRHAMFPHGIFINADCRLAAAALAAEGFRAPLVLCDPPWLPPALASTSSRQTGGKKPITETRQSSAAMLQILADRILGYALEAGESAAIFSGELFLGGLLSAAVAAANVANSGIITWEKSTGHVKAPLARRSEFVFYASRRNSQELGIAMKGRRFLQPVLKHQSVHHRERIHASEKPPELYADILAPLTREGDIVIDLFAGSAPIIPAAAATGRRFIACEIDAGTYRAALRHRQAAA